MAEKMWTENETDTDKTEFPQETEQQNTGIRFGWCLAVQVVVCAAMLLAAWGLRSSSPDVFAQTASQYRAVMNQSIDYRALLSDAFDSVRAWVADAANHNIHSSSSDLENGHY